MDQTFEYELAKDEYVLGLQTLMQDLASTDAAGPRRIWEQLAAVTAALMVTAYIFPYQFSGLLALTVFVALIEIAFRGRWAKKSVGASYDPKVAAVRVAIGDAAIKETGEHHERTWDWDALRKVHDHGSAVVFLFSGWEMLVLPSRLWSDDGARKSFLAELAVHGAVVDGNSAMQRDAGSQMPAEMILLAAIGAAADLAFLTITALPHYLGMFDDEGSGRGTVAAVLVLATLAAAVAGYFAARAALPALQRMSPVAAKLAAAVLIWAIPAYIAISMFQQS